MSILEANCRALLKELDMASSGDLVAIQPLSGGVASDIARVQVNDQALCMKFALPKLKVQEDWFAPVHRYAAEYAWLQVAASIAPNNSIALYGKSDTLHGFAMEFLSGDDVFLWKTALLAENQDRGEAALVGDLVGRVHAASTQAEFEQQAFQNQDDFHALRIEPYLLFTASRHKEIAPFLSQLANQLYESRKVLIHGDISPKNILIRDGQPVLLDAECATMGDACFDTAFCLNHLVLKAIHRPKSMKRYLQSAENLWQAYSAHVSWEPLDELEARVCHLIPALLLARVDGKSPVDYLSASEQVIVRQIARHFIQSPVCKISELITGIQEKTTEINL